MAEAISFSVPATGLGAVDDRMFGGNFLIDRDRMDDGTYDEAIEGLGLTNVRYPGGTVTEWFFDINDPDKTTGWDPQRGAERELLPLSTFLKQMDKANVGVNLVIPTKNLLKDGNLGDRVVKDTAYDDVEDYVFDVLSGKYDDAEIVSFEIGNEYWLGGEMDVTEYARVASVVAEATQDAIDTFKKLGLAGNNWDEPEISIQIGQYGAFSRDLGWVQNDFLIDAITDEAAEALDAVVAHYYASGDYDDLASLSYRFDRLDTWNAGDRYGDLEYHITEWNVAGNASYELGLRQASVMLFQFSEMVAQGVDAAYAWPIQQNTQITLTGNEGDDALRFSGELFGMLSESVAGMELVLRQGYETGDIYVYSKGAETVVFVASRADNDTTIKLDLASLGLEGSSFWQTHLGTLGDTDDPLATPLLEIHASTHDATARETFDLGAYGVLRINFLEEGASKAMPTELLGTGAADIMSGSEFNDVLKGLDGGDQISGSYGDDHLYGGAGDDFITGSDGADTLRLGSGNDTVYGGDQGDSIWGGTGNDKVYGGNGRDVVDLGDGADVFWDNEQGDFWGQDKVDGGRGNDIIHGGAGDDQFWGGDGQDLIEGGGGDDMLAGGRHMDILRGGYGKDSIFGGAGADVLEGEAHSDRLSGGNGADTLFGGEGNDKLYGDKGNDRLIGGAGNDVLDGGDGADVFVFQADDGFNKIKGFTEEDLVEIDVKGASFANLKITSGSGDTATVEFEDTVLTFVGLDADLDSSDFLFV